MKPPPQRIRFTSEEDAKLRSLVEQFGTSRWNEIARFFPRRSSRQCRDRYVNYLLDSLVRNPWTCEEDALVIAQVREIGPKWVQIGKMLRGRSATNVKNRWYKRLRRSAPQLSAPTAALHPIREQSRPIEPKPVLNLSQILGITESDWPRQLALGNSDTREPPSEASVWTVGDEFSV
jgi:hypothetical protein